MEPDRGILARCMLKQHAIGEEEDPVLNQAAERRAQLFVLQQQHAAEAAAALTATLPPVTHTKNTKQQVQPKSKVGVGGGACAAGRRGGADQFGEEPEKSCESREGGEMGSEAAGAAGLEQRTPQSSNFS